MQIALNNGAAFDIPVIDFGYPSTISLMYNYTNEPFYYYKQGSSLAVFNVLAGFTADVDALHNSISRPRDIKLMCDTLRAANYHDESYFLPENEGGQILMSLNEHIVWIVGSFEKGGIVLCKIGNVEDHNYAFVAFDGKYTDGTYTLYAYYTSGYEYEGEWRGVYTKDELKKGTLCWYTDTDIEYPPIYLLYQPENYEWAYVSGFTWNALTGAFHSDWSYDTIYKATDNANWKSADLGLHYVPEQPFCCVDIASHTFDVTKGLNRIGDHFSDSGYEGDGRNIYGGSAISDDDNPFAHGGYNTNGGGGGSWDTSSDQGGYTKDDQFDTDALNSGFFTVYNPTKSEIISFNDYLFTDITDSMAAQLKKLIADPLDYVVFMAMCHFTPTVKNVKYPIKFCGLNSGVSANVVENQMQFIQCGTVYINDDNETKSFLSYNPFFKCHLYLPYIGMVDLQIDDVMDCYISVQYIVDMLTGSCVAQVISKRTRKRCMSDIPNNDGIVIGEYTGNCFENLPLSATDWRGLFQGVIQFAGGLTSAAGGNVAGLGAMASAVMSDKVSVSRSGQLGANYGYMGFQKPYFIFERSNVAIAGDFLGSGNRSSFGGWQGWTCNILKPLGDFRGYTEVRPECLWTDSLNGITEAESAMMKDLFASGVYLNWE
jgi:hypothetical protein